MPEERARPRPIAEMFVVALGLGLTSFGGPAAHIGYFERAYVQKRQWLRADEFAALLALCQLVPGPASSQLGYLIGLRRAGWLGGLASWLGFTLPSALIMAALAMVVRGGAFDTPIAHIVVHALQLVAVAVVAQAVWMMARSLCPDLRRAVIGLGAFAVMLGVGGVAGQMAALSLGGVLGALWCASVSAPAAPIPTMVSRRVAGLCALAVSLLLAVALGLGARHDHQLATLAARIFRSGALVFGGGHVVLPLLRASLVPDGWLDDPHFLAGYGAAQAIPGPLFTFAAYLGAASAPQAGPLVAALWAGVALAAIFLPGLLIATAVLPVWSAVARYAPMRAALAGVNAAVVGLLAAALVTPVASTALVQPSDVAIAALGIMLLIRWRAPPLLVVVVTLICCLGAGSVTL